MSKQKCLSTIASVFLILVSACNLQRIPTVVSTPNQEPTAQSMGVASTSVPTTTVTASGDRVYPVDLIAKPGILQGHGRDETEYRDLTPGAPLPPSPPVSSPACSAAPLVLLAKR